jgi:hypothetical protein
MAATFWSLPAFVALNTCCFSQYGAVRPFICDNESIDVAYLEHLPSPSSTQLHVNSVSVHIIRVPVTVNTLSSGFLTHSSMDIDWIGCPVTRYMDISVVVFQGRTDWA